MLAGVRTALLGGQAPYADYALALDFKNGIYRAPSGIVAAPSLLPGYSYTRAGAKSELDANGTPLAFAANVPGIVPGVGYWSRGALTNFLKSNRDLGQASWNKRGTATVATDTQAGADASGLAYKVSGLGANPTNDLFQTIAGGLGASVRVEPSFFIKKVSASGILRIRDAQTGAGGGDWSINLASLGIGWERVTRSHPAVAISTEFVSTAGGAGGVVFDTASGTISFYIDFASIVVGTQPGPIIVTAGSAGAVGADPLNLVNPITADEDFAALVALILDSGSAGIDRRPISLSDGTSNNRLVFQISAGNVVQPFGTAAGTSVVFNTTGATPAVTSGRIVLCLRRKGGAWSFASKVGGVVAIGAGATAGAFPSNMSRLDVGNYLAGNQALSPIEFVGIRRGTFSDADLTALLAAA